jgi:hypothetical protein
MAVRKTKAGLNLKRWFKEKWQTQSGEKDTGGERKTFRPSVRVSSETPTTWGELSSAEKARAAKEKKEKGKVSRFKLKKKPKK